MKKPRFKFSPLILLLLIGLSSCLKDDDLSKYTIELELDSPEFATLWVKDGVRVSIKNENKGISFESLTNVHGKAVFTDVEPGFYTVSASLSVVYNNRERLLNAYMELEVNNDFSGILNLKIAEIGRFVISQFYYSGYLSQGGKLSYSDQFIEIYNNSNDTLFADGLSIIEHEASGDKPSEWEDWEATHMVVKAIWTIPGNGSDVQVLPGKSLVIASNAFNHQSDPNGDKNSPVDLGNADFEYHVLSESGRDIDYPDVENLIEDLFVLRGTVSYFDVRGGSAMALAWLPKNRQNYIEENMVSLEFHNKIRYYCTIPNEFIEDAIEPVFADREPFKRLDPALDVGYVAVEAGSKSGLCIRRKIENELDGRKILKDTNNSTEDFDHDVVPNPRIFDVKN